MTPTTTIGQQLVADCKKTGHYSSVGCPGHVRYFSGLTWNFPLPQFIYVVNQSFPSPPHISSKVYTGLSCPVLLLSTISISQVPREEFDDVLAQRPQLLVCSVEFLQNTDVGLFPFNPIGTQGFFLQVRDAIASSRLAPRGRRPVVCIDEAQVTSQV